MIEAGVALFLLVFIVWWTMYSGKKPTHDTDAQRTAQELEAARQREADKLER